MLQSFLVSLAMAVLKYYATIAGKEITAYIKEQEELKNQQKKVDEYKTHLGKSRKERQDAEDSLLS